jgi:hypothetical protein
MRRSEISGAYFAFRGPALFAVPVSVIGASGEGQKSERAFS